MKKGLLVALLLMLPIFIFADECDYKKHEEYFKFASYITYEKEYNSADRTFTVTIYNVIDGLYIKNGNVTYNRNEDDTVVINGMKQGTSVILYIYGKDGCTSQAGTIAIDFPYYNPYYGTQICNGYENLTLCASRFTTTLATEDMIKKMKDSYNQVIIQDADQVQKEEEEGTTFFNYMWDIFVKYISKVLLVVFSSGITIMFFNNKMIRIEHGF